MKLRTLFFSLLSLTALTSAAHAQSAGFSLDRFEPSERGSDWFTNESLDLRGHLRPALGVVGDWAYRPLIIYQGDEELAKLVEHQVFAHVGGSVVFFDRFRLGANLPVLAYHRGEKGTFGGTRYATNDSSKLGDVRLTADARLFGVYGDPLTLAAGVQVFLPTGSQDAFSGDEKVRVQPRVMAAGDVDLFTYAARVGFQYRALNENFAGDAFGSEMTFAAAAGVRLMDKRLTVGPEVFGSTVVSDSGDGFFSKRTTPLEAIVGGKYAITDDLKAGAGAGAGLTRGVGAPELRVVASVEWFPKVEEKPTEPVVTDRDGDGIDDTQDACPDQPGLPSADPQKNGCPPPPDRDGDGIDDAQDACPDLAGPPNADPQKNGCPPPPDRDGDGIIDPEDACPDEAGVATTDPKTNGCPPPKDTDGDTILDPVDACPDEPGVPNADPKKNGCPTAKVAEGQITILEQVQFDTGKATIKPESDTVLNAVLKVLTDHPEITKLSVEGHTDNRAGRGFNVTLSKQRAAAVVKWLVGHGIDKKRLSSTGFGPDKPIASNDTEEGRAQNRRVEFHIVEPKK